MENGKLHRLFKKIFSDEQTRAQFMSSPESVIRQFSLSDEEKKAVLKAHARLGLVTPDSQMLEQEIGPNTWWTGPVP